MKNVISFTLLWTLITTLGFSQATIPAAQTLPYKQDFAGFSTSSSTYPVGWQGWQLDATGSSANFRLTSPISNLSLTPSATAATTTAGVLNYNEKLGILASVSPSSPIADPALCLAVNTTGKVNVVVTFDVSTIRNPFVSGTQTLINNVELQYRIGPSLGAFTSLSGNIYSNINSSLITGTNPQRGKRFQFILPASCENQSVVQLRWVQRDFSGVGTNRPSFAIDNVIVCPSPIVSATVKSACGGNNGAITLSVSAGMTPYTFSWDNTNIVNGPVFAVTAVSKTSHPNPTAFGIVYALDGIQGKVLSLTRGIDYTFSGTFPGHPFHITSSTLGGGQPGIVQSGTTNNLINVSTDGSLIFTPNSTHPALLYYQCNVHQQMGWKINMNDGSLTTQNISNLAPGKYAAAIFSADGSITTILVTVPTGTAPIANATSNTPVCDKGLLMLQASGGTSYSWSGPLGFSSTQQNPTINFLTTSNAGTYTLIATAANGCTSSDIENVVVNVSPSLLLISPDIGPEGTLVMLNGTNLSNVNQVNIGSTTAVPTIINSTQLKFNIPIGATTDFIKVTNTNGCKDTSDNLFTVLNIHLNLRCFIQGFYDPNLHQMNSTVPLGADTVTIQLYNSSNLISPAFSDTRVIDINGNGIFYFPQSVNTGNYFIVVKHRNSIETWSKNLVSFSPTTFYDFTQ